MWDHFGLQILDVPPPGARVIRSRYRPSPPDYNYLVFRDNLELEYKLGATIILCPNGIGSRPCPCISKCPFKHTFYCELCRRILVEASSKRNVPRTCSICKSEFPDPGEGTSGSTTTRPGI